ncbi:serine hydrolase domain-containing protein [Novosphingobium sp.]|uniref:serine hydrolase domain-containing protein n=1 Tax=Novosphingobium sp. TaxID=1874826 RepID=UPI003BAAF504
MTFAALFADIAPDAPGCAAAIVEDGAPVWQGCFGLANTATGAAITPQTRFRIASMTKPMVAMVLLALADAGRLALSDCITRWVPELRAAEPPMLAQLLAMQSGLPEGPPLHWLVTGDSGREGVGLDAVLALQLAQRSRIFAPGSRTVYANSNYLLLQLAAERAAGAPLATLLQTHVFSPAGMADARLFDAPTAALANMALAHAVTPDGLSACDPHLAYGAAGGIVASLADMIAWLRWLQTNPRDWRARLGANVPHSDGSPSGYALGFMRQSLGGRLTLGHSGQINQWAGEFLLAPDHGSAAVILGNRSDINWFERVRELLTLRWGIAPDPAMTPGLAIPSPPEPRWTALYASAEHGFSLNLSGCPGEINVGGRRIPMQPDGRYRRNLGVEPICFEIAGDLSFPPASIVRQEGNIRMQLLPAASGIPPDPAALLGLYRHPDLPESLQIGLDGEGRLRLRAGPLWPGGDWLQLRWLGERFYAAADKTGCVQDPHLRFEDGAVIVSFLRLPGLRMARDPGPAPDWPADAPALLRP